MKTDNENQAKKSFKPTGHVFDVIHPNRVTPQTTSKPVIVGHKPQVQDQMVGGTTERFAASPNEKHELMDGSKRVIVQPPATPDNAVAEPASPTLTSEKAKQPVESIPATAAATPQSTSDENTVGATEAAASPASPALEQLVVNQVVDAPEDASSAEPVPHTLPSGSGAPAQNTPSDSRPPLTDEMLGETLAPLLEEEKMIVSHHRHGISLLGFLLMLVLVILLALAAFNFLLDAEIIQFNTDLPHTDLL